MSKLLSGKEVSAFLKENLKKEIKNLNLKLVVITIGNDEASKIYVRNKEKACNEVGIDYENICFPDNICEDEIINKIKELNNDNKVTSILLQLPISKHLDSKKIIDCIDPNKDVDGLSTTNIGKLFNNNDPIIPCTAKGVVSMLKFYNISIEGKNVCICGRSSLVGKPLIGLLLNLNATVSVVHSKTKDVSLYTKKADIIITAVGKPNFLNSDMIKKNSIVIDVGINRLDNKIVGDVSFSDVSKKASFITPVPGGVGVMTVTSLLENVYECYKKTNNL